MATDPKPTGRDQHHLEHRLDRWTLHVARIAQYIFAIMVVWSLLFTICLLVVVGIEGGAFLKGLVSFAVSHEEMIPDTLGILEQLLLAPLPFIISIHLYNWSLALGSHSTNETAHSEKRDPLRAFAGAKGLVIGLMISAVGVDLVEAFLQKDFSMERYVTGGGVILALSIFYVVLHRETG